MKGLSLAQFKKMKEDAQSATLIHKDGHQLVISKGSLSPMHKKQLEALEMHEQHFDEGGAAQPEQPLEIEPVNPVMASGQAPDQTPQRGPAAAQSPVAPAAQEPPFQTTIQSQIPGFAEEKAANLAGAQALGAQGAQESAALQQVNQDIAKLPTQADIVNHNAEASNKLFDAYKQERLNPDKYWEDHSKIAAGIGLLLSSAGDAAGAKGGTGALDVINLGINREIDRQKNAQGQAMNLWRMNREALGTDLGATLATQNQLYTGLKYKLEKAAADAKGPLAIANAQAANAKIDQAIGANNFKISLMNPTSDNPDPTTRVQFLVPPDKQAKVFSEIDAAKNTVQNSKGIDEAFWQAAKDARPLSGGTGTSVNAFIPGLKSPGQQALVARLGPTFSDIEGTVRQSAMDSAEHNMVPAFGDSDKAIQTKWKSLQDYKTSKAAASTAKGFGIDLSKFPSTNINGMRSAAPPQEQGAMTRGGVEYQRQIINGKAYMVPKR